MERVSITAKMREPGKGVANRLRTSGKIPGIIYGKKVEPVSISVDEIEMEKATHTSAGMNVIVDLAVEGGDKGLAFIRDYQADPFKRRFTHVDFQAISMDEPIEIEIPIVLTGECKGVKEGGVISQARRTLHVRSLPDRIPDKIEIDITELMIGDNVHADDVSLPEGVEFPHASNYALLSVVPPTKEEEVAPAAAAEGEEGVEGAEGEEGAEKAAEGAEGAEGAEKAEKGKEEQA